MITGCPREHEVWDAIATGRWPDTAPADLRAHAASCAVCRELALVAGAVQSEGVESRRAAAPPTSGIVWWRAQMRARQEAAQAADRPITIAQALAVAAGGGLTLALLSVVVSWLRPFVVGFAQSAQSLGALPALGLTEQWGPILAGALFMTVVLAPVALYLALADDRGFED